MVVVWSRRAELELKKAFDYIALDSYQNAKMVRDEIIDITIELAKNPNKYPIDKFKIKNDGTWRAFERFRYCISYRILKDQIRIVRIRHTSRPPLDY